MIGYPSTPEDGTWLRAAILPSSKKDRSRALALEEGGAEGGGIFWLRRHLCALRTLCRENILCLVWSQWRKGTLCLILSPVLVVDYRRGATMVSQRMWLSVWEAVPESVKWILVWTTKFPDFGWHHQPVFRACYRLKMVCLLPSSCHNWVLLWDSEQSDQLRPVSGD